MYCSASNTDFLRSLTCARMASIHVSEGFVPRMFVTPCMIERLIYVYRSCCRAVRKDDAYVC